MSVLLVNVTSWVIGRFAVDLSKTQQSTQIVKAMLTVPHLLLQAVKVLSPLYLAEERL